MDAMNLMLFLPSSPASPPATATQIPLLRHLPPAPPACFPTPAAPPPPRLAVVSHVTAVKCRREAPFDNVIQQDKKLDQAHPQADFEPRSLRLIHEKPQRFHKSGCHRRDTSPPPTFLL